MPVAMGLSDAGPIHPGLSCWRAASLRPVEERKCILAPHHSASDSKTEPQKIEPPQPDTTGRRTAPCELDRKQGESADGSGAGQSPSGIIISAVQSAYEPSDSAARGQLPTHPELLDWLAMEIMTPTPPGAAGERGRDSPNPFLAGERGSQFTTTPLPRCGEGAGVRG